MTRVFARSILLLATAVGITCSLSAQALGKEAALNVFAGVVNRLGADTTLPDSLRHLTVADLLSPANTDNVRLLDDAGTQLYMQALSALAHQLPPRECGALLSPDAEGPTDMDMVLSYADSASVALWAVLVERMARARATNAPGGRVAATAELQEAIVAGIRRMSDADQTRLITIARNPPPSPDDACWSVQQTMTMFAGLPPAELGPVVRALFGADSSP